MDYEQIPLTSRENLQDDVIPPGTIADPAPPGSPTATSTGGPVVTAMDPSMSPRPRGTFGMMPWVLPSHKKIKKVRSDRSWLLAVGNIGWVIVFGWWLAGVFLLAGCLVSLSIVGVPYGLFCFRFARFLLWPFNLFFVVPLDSFTAPEEELPLKASIKSTFSRVTIILPKTALHWFGYIFYLILGAPFIILALIIALWLSYFTIIFIPMAKILKVLLKLSPFDTTVIYFTTSPGSVPEKAKVLVTPCAINLNYYYFTIGGLSVFIFNLFIFVPIAFITGYVLEDSINPIANFALGLIATVPLAFTIGQAISSLSAKSSFAIGAFLNSMLGSIIELILYTISLAKGLTDLTASGVTGALLGSAILLPAISMIVGGIKYSELRFNPIATATSGSLLLVSVVGALVPTIFYAVYADYNLDCTECDGDLISGDGSRERTVNMTCTGCQMGEDTGTGSAYQEAALPLSWLCACLLPLAYLVGCIFALKTHSYMYDKKFFEQNFVNKPEHDDKNGDSNEEQNTGNTYWGIVPSIICLVVCVVLFAGVADVVTAAIEPMLQQLGVSEEFIGVTFIAIVPNLAEYVNASMFALRGDLDLSLEISGQGAVQVSLLQIPILVFLSAILSNGEFTMIFSRMHMVTIVLAVLIRNSTIWDSRANYFLGSSLLVVWIILVAAYWFVPAETVVSSVSSSFSSFLSSASFTPK
ncbi:DUF307 family protein [Pelomyxa schiedti]|nr:DUF307 family protein [Pelomyxa schiedti]